MNTNALFVWLAITTFVATASPVFSQQGPPPSERAKQVEALVTKAAALIDDKGKAAFEDFRKKDSDWFHGDTYLFVYDMNANVLLNPAFPKREGTNVSGQKDAKGKLFHNEIIRTAEMKGSGWAAKRASRNFPAAKASPPRCITAGPRSFLRPASTGWRGGTERSEAMKKADGLRHAADA